MSLARSGQSLSCVGDLRNFFLIPDNYKHCKSLLVQRFGELLRKVAALVSQKVLLKSFAESAFKVNFLTNPSTQP